MTIQQNDAALGHLRVLDLTSPLSQSCARIFADLGAEVVKIEPPGGDASRRHGPFLNDNPVPENSLDFITFNRGKKSVVLDIDLEPDRDRLRTLAQSVDILIEDFTPGYLAQRNLGYDQLRILNPSLVYVSITPFGQTGPNAQFLGDDLIAQAAGGIMYANGDDTERPCMAPDNLLAQIACMHAAFGALAAIRARKKTNRGQHIDVSRQEVVLYAQGNYIPRYSALHEIPHRERLSVMGGVNIYRTADDGYVSFAPFMPHHFTRLAHDVMSDEELAKPEWADAPVRREKRVEIDDRVAEYAITANRDDLVERGQASGVPTVPILEPHEFADHPHENDRGFFQNVDQPGAGTYRTAGPPALFGATPWRVDKPAPHLGEHTEEILATLANPAPTTDAAPPTAKPSTNGETDSNIEALSDLRVVDFTRAFAGPLATMFMGYFGAEIVKVESAELEDSRNPGQPTFPELNRAKLSCTIDTRLAEGKDLVKRLVQDSGILVENFRPGVMDRLNLSYEELRAVRPDLIMLAMPGFGNSGPLKNYYSYGQQVMGMTGLLSLWGHPQSPIDARVKYAFPDYVAGIAGSLSILAALEYRDRTGRGQYIEMSQVEALAHLLSNVYTEYTDLGRKPNARGNDSLTSAPHDVYPALGHDAWCAIEVRSDGEWESFVKALNNPAWAQDTRFGTLESRLQHKADLDRHIAEWTKERTPHQAALVLQSAGVPAAPVATAEDLYRDPHLRARGMIVTVDHREGGRIAHAGVNVHLSDTPGHADRHAPAKGQDNEYVFDQILRLTESERMSLDAAGALR